MAARDYRSVLHCTFFLRHVAEHIAFLFMTGRDTSHFYSRRGGTLRIYIRDGAGHFVILFVAARDTSHFYPRQGEHIAFLFVTGRDTSHFLLTGLDP